MNPEPALAVCGSEDTCISRMRVITFTCMAILSVFYFTHDYRFILLKPKC